MMNDDEGIQQEIELLDKYSDQDLNDHILRMSTIVTSVHYHDSTLKDGVDVGELRINLRICQDELMRRRG